MPEIFISHAVTQDGGLYTGSENTVFACILLVNNNLQWPLNRYDPDNILLALYHKNRTAPEMLLTSTTMPQRRTRKTLASAADNRRACYHKKTKLRKKNPPRTPSA